MSVIKCFALTKDVVRYNPVLYTVIRHHWNKDFKPARLPTTEADRIAAARKYNLVPSEYETYADNGFNNTGDYPKLPLVSGDSKDPHYPYDFPELKRNFQEPIHVEQELIGEDRYDVSKRHRIPPREQWLQFFGVVGGFFLLYFALQDSPMFHSLVPKQYPAAHSKHYTFESN